jgi:hypothetical protein
MAFLSEKDHVFVAARDITQRIEGGAHAAPASVNDGKEHESEHGKNLSRTIVRNMDEPEAS